MNPRKFVKGLKTVSAVAVTLGVGVAVGTVSRKIVPANANMIQKACVSYATIIIADYISDNLNQHVNNKVDEIFT